ncbi:UDP-glucuronosyltransferase 3A1-like isoform X1 [Sturnira hondurensis]|uniref:UDP-glucuronosyltransferase 3A1-like isoform X1 n=1 Tax=Sturnira hondurensis TaxID=192404 RepID=UPI00187A21BF|nr:UDP-glucuronosyltransferase 3A1-like isoform X1 [Sturnira hondurensis]
MAGQPVWLLLCLLSWLPLLEGAKILTLSLFGGSHYLLMDRVSQTLQDHGHDVTFLQSSELSFTSGFKVEKKYQVVVWSPPEDYNQEYKKYVDFFLNEGLQGRDLLTNLLKFMKLHAMQCSHLLRSTDIMGALKNASFDLVVIDGSDSGAFLLAEKLGRPWVAILPVTFGGLSFGLPEPVSYVPVFSSLLTDRMDFWGRVKNSLMVLISAWVEWSISAQFDDLIREHFPEDSRPVLFHLRRKAELWFVNSDFALEFARPLLPNTVYIGGLMSRPVEPVPPEYEKFIASFGDAGFVLVALGSVVSNFPPQMLKEMNSAFEQLPQGVIWKCSPSRWPRDIKLAANVKIVDWLPQNDLLAHPSIRLFVTHGGLNSVMESIQHGVPMVGIPLQWDQPENIIRVEAKNLGVSIRMEQLTAETLVRKMKQVIEDKRYKAAAVAASIIRHSHPLTPAQRLVGWIDHILQTGGAAHLKPHAFQQPWYEQYLLDVFLFLLVLTLGTAWLCGKLLGLVARWLCGARKLKTA